MIKYVCDACGEEADEQEYIVPVSECERTFVYSNGVPVVTFESYTIHLCDRCKKYFAYVIGLILGKNET